MLEKAPSSPLTVRVDWCQPADSKAYFIVINVIFDREAAFLPAVRERGAEHLHGQGRDLREHIGRHIAQMAGDMVAGRDLAHLRLLLRAAGKGIWATRVE